LFIKSDRKYWLLSIPLWTLVFSSFILWRTNSDKHIQATETEYWNEKKEDNAKWNSLELAKKKTQKLNMVFIYLIGLQTLITFICQLVGQQQTKQKIYKWTKPIFGVLLVLIFLLIAMMGIVPSGGIIG